MNSHYRQIILAIIISLCFAIIRLNADLLNGPWSPESQELVKLMRDPKLPVPPQFKAQESNIALLRKALKDPKQLHVTLGDSSFLNLLGSNPLFLEATIQFIQKLHPSDEELKLEDVDTLYQYRISMIAYLATQLTDVKLYKLAINALSSIPESFSKPIKSRLLRLQIHYLFNPQSADYLKNSDFPKIVIPFIISSLPNSLKTIVPEEVAINIADVTYSNDINSMKTALDFLIDLGFNVNFVFDSRKENIIRAPQASTFQATLLDVVNNIINYYRTPTEAAAKPHLSELAHYKQEKIKSLESIKAYFISKGAITYATLVAMQKRQR